MGRKYKTVVQKQIDSVYFSINTFSHIYVDNKIHAKDDALVSYAHAEYAHKKIKQPELILFDTDGHGMLPQMEEVRK